MPTSNHSKQILIGNFKTQSHDLCKELFCSQVFHTTSNVLNVDVNIVNIALIAFCSPVVAKSARWPMSSLLSCQSIVCYSCRLFKLCFDWIQLKMVSQFLWLLCARRRCLDLARCQNLATWPSLARWSSTLLARWPIVELASSIKITSMAFN